MTRKRRGEASPKTNNSAAETINVNEVFDACYHELRRLAHNCLSTEHADRTLQTSDLLHEAYLKLVNGAKLECKTRVQFFALASQVMRHVLVDYARRRRSIKRFGNQRRVPLQEALTVCGPSVNIDLVALDLALSGLASEDPVAVRIIEMRFFGGMTYSEISHVLKIKERTLKRRADYAQARLYEKMSDT